MSSFGSQMAKRLNELRKAGRDVKRAMAEAAEGATIEAVRVAAENTPPNGGTDIAGTNMRSGQMAHHRDKREDSPGQQHDVCFLRK